MPWICQAVDSAKTAGEIAVRFYQVLPDYSVVF